MTSFVHLEYSNRHPGVARVESAIDAAQKMRRGFSGTRGMAKLLLSAMVAAAMVVAYQVMDSVAEGQLLVLWIAMWAVAFVALASFAGAARIMAVRIKHKLDGWSSNLAAKRADERLWAMAKTDARLMADLQCAISRSETGNDLRDEGLRFVAPSLTLLSPLKATTKAIPSGAALMRAYKRHYI